MTANKNLFIIPVVLISTMACAFVQNMVFPPSPTPGFSSPQLSTPTAISLTPAEVYVPTSEWISNPEPITCTNDKCLNACLDRLDQVLETRPFAPIGNSIYEEQGASFDLVVYKVNGDEILEPAVLYVPLSIRNIRKILPRICGFGNFTLPLFRRNLENWSSNLSYLPMAPMERPEHGFDHLLLIRII